MSDNSNPVVADNHEHPSVAMNHIDPALSTATNAHVMASETETHDEEGRVIKNYDVSHPDKYPVKSHMITNNGADIKSGVFGPLPAGAHIVVSDNNLEFIKSHYVGAGLTYTEITQESLEKQEAEAEAEKPVEAVDEHGKQLQLPAPHENNEGPVDPSHTNEPKADQNMEDNNKLHVPVPPHTDANLGQHDAPHASHEAMNPGNVGGSFAVHEGTEVEQAINEKNKLNENSVIEPHA